MSAQYKMTIPDELEDRIEQMEGTYQQITLRALHILIYGSEREQELRAQVAWLQNALLACKGASPPPPPPQPTSEKELGW